MLVLNVRRVPSKAQSFNRDLHQNFSPNIPVFLKLLIPILSMNCIPHVKLNDFILFVSFYLKTVLCDYILRSEPEWKT